MNISATELKNRLGRYLDSAETEPIIIEKSGRAKSVLISHAMLEKLMALEDAYWAEQAKRAESEEYLAEDEVTDLLSRAS